MGPKLIALTFANRFLGETVSSTEWVVDMELELEEEAAAAASSTPGAAGAIAGTPAAAGAAGATAALPSSTTGGAAPGKPASAAFPPLSGLPGTFTLALRVR